MKPPILIIFGITGDLSKRKLLPALYRLMAQQLLPEGTKIIGISRRPLNTDELLGKVELCILEKDNVCDPVGIQRLREALESFQLNPTEDEDYEKMRSYLESFDKDGLTRERIYYMSIPPDAYGPIVVRLGEHQLNDGRSRMLVEKPFGYDIHSATELVDLVKKHFNESQVYRIDHYLAKETAQNLLTFRLYNPIFSTLWNSQHIERVEVKAYEKISIENRVEFYEKTGALRDLIQSHLLQLLAITLMDLPSDMSSDEIHRSKQYFLEQLKAADPKRATRAQYEGYRAEVNSPESTTETYAKLHLNHSAERWAGVDMIVETGKGLAEKNTAITVYFKTNHDHSSNNLTFNIQPNEGITLDLIVKAPGIENNISHTKLNFDYKKLFGDTMHIDAYERVLLDAVRGDRSLFSSDEEVLATWRVLQPVLEEWGQNDSDLLFYKQGAEPDSIAGR